MDELCKDIELYRARRAHRLGGNVKKDIDNFEQCGIINSDEWEEEKHPRDKNGKFSSSGGSHAKAAEKKSGKARALAYPGPEFEELNDRISRGDYLPIPELLNHPAVKALDEKARECRAKYGDTSHDHSEKRRALRRDIAKRLLNTGSAVVKRDADGHKQLTYDGPLKKEFKACIAIGLPASGKSTNIVEPYSEANGAFVADSDRVKEEFPEYQETNGAAASCVHQESRRLLRNRILGQFDRDGSMNGTNIVVPIVGSDLYDVMDYIDRFEKAGYTVKVQFQPGDPTESANRSVMRAIQDGRIIPSKNVASKGDRPRQTWHEIQRIGGGKYVD